MTDNELLLAISNIIDKKIEPLKKDIEEIKQEQTRINIIIENDIKRDIKMLAENYLPAAKRFDSESDKIEALESDVSLLKKVVTEHSEKLQKIS
ncbi:MULTISPECIES: hypothetical protein [Robinsoniella]|uniref:hypothetical protein n=1 Tax=Robinsoniella TaxID=588605 RepID=UPI0004835523|nr:MULTISPECIES: hypothetical protein [Robinsoniella]